MSGPESQGSGLVDRIVVPCNHADLAHSYGNEQAAVSTLWGNPKIILEHPICSCAGLPQEGVAALQEAGLWRYAATLTAHTLKGDERAAALERWAAHVHQVRPSSVQNMTR